MTSRTFFVLLMVCYLSAAGGTLLLWHLNRINPVTGDEPHYLVMTSGLVRHGSFEQTLAYADEAKTHEIYWAALPDAHLIAGPHGYYNKHGIGLPILLAVPFALRGVLGAKLFMILVGSGVVVLSWLISGLFATAPINRFLSVFAVCIGMPLIPASNQIYTDIPAGLIALAVIYLFLVLEKTDRLGCYLPIVMGLAFLPWLHVRYAATAIVLLTAIACKVFVCERPPINIGAVVVIGTLLVSSVAGLAAYNLFAFGNPAGPFNQELQINVTSLMVLFGLFADQNEGFLFQNPVMLVGLLSLGSLFAADRKLFALWCLVFLSLIVPNALETNLYGGYNFSGRYQWAASMVFILPALFGLTRMSMKMPRIFYAVIGTGLVIQAYYFWQYAVCGVKLYKRPASTLVEDYSIFYGGLSFWLPMLYNANIALKYLPNLGWFIALCSLTAAGFVVANRKARSQG